MAANLRPYGCCLVRVIHFPRLMLPWLCSTCGGIASLHQQLPVAARWRCYASCAAPIAACRRRPTAMAEQWKRETLVTLPVSTVSAA